MSWSLFYQSLLFVWSIVWPVIKSPINVQSYARNAYALTWVECVRSITSTKDKISLEYINGCKHHLARQFCKVELSLKFISFLTNLKEKSRDHFENFK